MVYYLDPNGRIIDVKSGNKCASEQVSFFQQIKRMDLSVEAAMEMAASDGHKAAGRCSVFARATVPTL